MSGYAGDIALGSTIDIKFTTVSTTGAPTTLAGSPAVAAYVDNGTTEITAGITLTVDFDARTGYHNVRVVATSGNTFAAGTNVSLAITAGTVGGTSIVGYEIGSFSIENRSSLRPTTAGRTLDVSAGGEAGVDWANVGSPTTAQNLSGTSTKALEPATAGRTLVVDAAGLADANTVKLGPSGTGTAQTARDIGASVVAASVAAGVTLANGAITTAKFAAGAIDNTVLATNAEDAISANVLAAAGVAPIASNLKKINGTTVNGDGAGTPWGP